MPLYLLLTLENMELMLGELFHKPMHPTPGGRPSPTRLQGKMTYSLLPKNLLDPSLCDYTTLEVHALATKHSQNASTNSCKKEILIRHIAWLTKMMLWHEYQET